MLLLGPILTTLSISDYFNHSLTNQYIQNISIFRMYYNLPGLFEFNVSQSINASLWTLPYELACYMFLGIMGLFYILKRKIIMLLFFGDEWLEGDKPSK